MLSDFLLVKFRLGLLAKTTYMHRKILNTVVTKTCLSPQDIRQLFQLDILFLAFNLTAI